MDEKNTADPKPGVTIQFFTADSGGGDLVYEVTVDAEGNFIVSESLSNWP